MTLKEKVHAHYVDKINDRINVLLNVLSDLKESGTNETKSTAGDKHETALAMLQIEQANTRAQLSEAQLQKTELEKIDPASNARIVGTGSLIKTERGYIFISAALGKAVIETFNVIAISKQSPLGKSMVGLKSGEVVLMNNIRYTIMSLE